MIKITSNSKHTMYGLKNYILDKKTDSVDVHMGSTAFCIEDNSAYMINSKSSYQLAINNGEVS